MRGLRNPSTGQVRAIAATLLVLLAGCAAPSADPAQDAATSGASSSAPPALAGAPVGEAPDPLALPWALPECVQHYVSIPQEEGAAQDGLSGGHQVQGEGVATLAVQATSCQALVLGNATIVEPFGLAVVYHLLQPDPDLPGAVHGYVRELFVTDPALAARLAAFGFPAMPADITVAGDGQTLALQVAAAGVEYQVLGPAPVDMGPASSTIASRFVATAAAREAWVDGDVKVSATSSFVPAVVRASGGYLGAALPAGAFAGQLTPSAASLALTFGERSL